MIDVYGTVAPGFEAVREEFAAVADGSGAQLAAYVLDRKVVDLAAGDGVTGDTLTGVYSSTKGAASLVTAVLVHDGALDLDAPIARVWPEFGTAGKERITLRDMLAHRSGLIGVEGNATVGELADDRVIAERLAGQRPYWRPGTAYGYAGFAAFAVVGEVIRRVTGQTLQRHFAERVREPYGLDLYLGLPEDQEHRFRDVLPGQATADERAAFWEGLPGPHSLLGVAYGFGSNPPLDQVGFANTRRVRALGQASGGGVGSARGLAGMYAAAVFGLYGAEPLLTPDTAAEVAVLHSCGGDLIRGDRVGYGLGFEAVGLRYPFLSARSFGHSGSAGSDGFADPVSGIAFGYTRRRFAFDWNYPERDRLAAAVYRAATA